jgi:hypothetical protein
LSDIWTLGREDKDNAGEEGEEMEQRDEGLDGERECNEEGGIPISQLSCYYISRKFIIKCFQQTISAAEIDDV